MGLFSKKKSTSSPTQNGQNSSPLSPLDMVINTINKQRAKSRIKPISRDDIEHLDFTIKPPLYRSHQDAISEGVAHGLRRNVGAQQEPELMLAEILMHTARTGGSKGKVLSLTPDRGVVSRFVRGNCNFFQIDTSSDPQRFITAARLILDHGSDLVTAKKITGGTLMKAVEQLFDNNEQECFYLNGDIPASMVSPMKSPPQNGSHTKSDPEESQPGPSGLTRSRGRTANQAAASKSAKSITGATACPLKAPYLELVPLRYALVESKERLKGNFFKHRYRFKEKQLGIRDARNGYIYQLHSDYPNQMREYTLKDGKLSLQKEVVKTGEAAVDYPAIKPYSEFKSEHILVPKVGCVYIAFSEVKWTEQRIQDFLASDDTNKSKMMQTVGIPAHPKMMGGNLDLLPPYQLDQAVSECMAPPAQKTQTTPSDETQQKEKEEPWCWVDGHYHGKGSPFNPMSVDDFKGRIEPSEMQDNAMFILLNDEAGMIRDLASLQDTVQSKIQALLEDVKYQDALNIQSLYQATDSQLMANFSQSLSGVDPEKQDNVTSQLQHYLQLKITEGSHDSDMIAVLSANTSLSELEVQLQSTLGDQWPSIQDKLDEQAKTYRDSRDGTLLSKGVKEITRFDEMTKYLTDIEDKKRQWQNAMGHSIEDMRLLIDTLPLSFWQYDLSLPEHQTPYSELSYASMKHLSRSAVGAEKLFDLYFKEINHNALIYTPLLWQNTINWPELIKTSLTAVKNTLDKGKDFVDKVNDHGLALKKVFEQSSTAITGYAQLQGDAAELLSLTRVSMLPGLQKLLANAKQFAQPGMSSYEALAHYSPHQFFILVLQREAGVDFAVFGPEHGQMVQRIESLSQQALNVKQKLTEAEATLAEKRSNLAPSKVVKRHKYLAGQLRKQLHKLDKKIAQNYDALRGVWDKLNPEQKQLMQSAISDTDLKQAQQSFTQGAVARNSALSRDGQLLDRLKNNPALNKTLALFFLAMDFWSLSTAISDAKTKNKTWVDNLVSITNALSGFTTSGIGLMKVAYLDQSFAKVKNLNQRSAIQKLIFINGVTATWAFSVFSFGAAASALAKDGKIAYSAYQQGDDPLLYTSGTAAALDTALSGIWLRILVRGVAVRYATGSMALAAEAMSGMLASGPIGWAILAITVAQIATQIWVSRNTLPPLMQWVNESQWGDNSKGLDLTHSRLALVKALHQPLLLAQDGVLSLLLPGVTTEQLGQINVGITRELITYMNGPTQVGTLPIHKLSADELNEEFRINEDDVGTTLSLPLAMFGDGMDEAARQNIPVAVELSATEGLLGDPGKKDTPFKAGWNIKVQGNKQQQYGALNAQLHYVASIRPATDTPNVTPVPLTEAHA